MGDRGDHRLLRNFGEVWPGVATPQLFAADRIPVSHHWEHDQQQSSKATVLQLRRSSTDRREQCADELTTSARDRPANCQGAVGTKLCNRACLKVRKPSLVASCAMGTIPCCPRSRLKRRRNRSACCGSERLFF